MINIMEYQYLTIIFFQGAVGLPGDRGLEGIKGKTNFVIIININHLNRT